MFEMHETEAKDLVEKKVSLPAYDQCLKASHVFNILDSLKTTGKVQLLEQQGLGGKFGVTAWK